MAHKKAASSSDNGRDSNSNRLGVKLFGSQLAKAGNIIVRQRGTKYHAGENVYMGKDHTLHAKIDGKVVFNKRRLNRMFVSIAPLDANGGTALKTKPAKKTVSKAPVAPKAAAPAAPVAPKATAAAKVALPSGKKIKIDDLTAIEGIGPKIAELLTNAGIATWTDLAITELDALKQVLADAGSRYTMHNPGTWSKQAAMAVAGDWIELEKYQDILEGGIEPTA